MIVKDNRDGEGQKRNLIREEVTFKMPAKQWSETIQKTVEKAQVESKRKRSEPRWRSDSWLIFREITFYKVKELGA